ncbi:MAG TPA: hypothetical protein PK307_03380 [Spirochaetota bacterium]|nr:hypothetical protein [Spirochaetota bacterium]HOD14457.1 hypothetical protein [Spirochaetota bacterium]HPG52435.1 hypothetical protein [Spirochaetota bacterium]HPN13056.1 hypothetical protein [Spirochaetota bacterium]HQL81214.1 hypothetical protein [Spirochaetota bacterium]
MKKAFVLTMLLGMALPAQIAGGNPAPAGAATLHFFTSGVCPACRRAERDLPALLKRHPGIVLATYEVRDSGNRVTATNRRNIGILVTMLGRINARVGGRPFIYESRTPFAYILVNGVPYYEKRVSGSLTVKKELPIPVFILGDRAYAGYSPEILDWALARQQSGK